MAYLYELSVVIPAYGTPDKLAACLEAALHQDLDADRFEIVVVDDCSPSSLEGVIRHYQTLYPEHHVVFSRNQVNSGRAATRNAGIRLARGRILFFLDLDNWLTPEALSQMLTYFEDGPASARANIASVPAYREQSSYIRFFNSRYLGQRPATELATMELNHLHERYFATDAMAVDCNSLNRVGLFDEEFSAYGCEDEELGLRLADAGVPLHLAKDVLVVDGDRPTVRRACERMIVYAQESVPTLMRKHPRYALHCMFPFLERPVADLNIQSRIIRSIFLKIIPFKFGQILVKLLEKFDSRFNIPGFAYKLALSIYYTEGLKRRNGE